jgi:hypothetical protein
MVAGHDSLITDSVYRRTVRVEIVDLHSDPPLFDPSPMAAIGPNGKVYIGTRGNNTGGVYGSSTVSGELDVYGLKSN